MPVAPNSSATLPLIDVHDLDYVFGAVPLQLWELLRGKSLFIAGATGFVGKWLLATLHDVDRRLELACRVTILSRDPERFVRMNPRFKGWITSVKGDITQLQAPLTQYDYVIHGATDVENAVSPREVFDACLHGTQRILEFSERANAGNFLLLSSGAIYGSIVDGPTNVAEDFKGGPDPLLPNSAYGEGKRVSEWLTCNHLQGPMQVKIARIFALVGPYLPLDKQFAIGNFLSAALRGETIVIQGDGTPFRSYLYAADMAIWLWKILLEGKDRQAYNVGSDVGLSILDLAHRINSLVGGRSKIEVRKEYAGQGTFYYVPDTRKARESLLLPEPLNLNDAINRTVAWLRANSTVG